MNENREISFKFICSQIPDCFLALWEQFGLWFHLSIDISSTSSSGLILFLDIQQKLQNKRIRADHVHLVANDRYVLE